MEVENTRHMDRGTGMLTLQYTHGDDPNTRVDAVFVSESIKFS